MNDIRPLARNRLHRAVEKVLGQQKQGLDEPTELLALRERISVLSQEKRFLLLVFLMRHGEPLSVDEIVVAIADHHSSVIRNLYVLVAEGLVLPSKGEPTEVVRYQPNDVALSGLGRFFDQGSSQDPSAMLGWPEEPSPEAIATPFDTGEERVVTYLSCRPGSDVGEDASLAGQARAVLEHAESRGSRIIAFRSELIKNGLRRYPELAAALETCRRNRAGLLISNLRIIAYPC